MAEAAQALNSEEVESTLSVVIPAYNAASTIGRALQSVIGPGIRKSPVVNVEILVVNDGSHDRDALRSVVGEYSGVRLLEHSTNRGMCAARNTGIFSSTGSFLTLLDADDEWRSDWPNVFQEIVAEWPSECHVCFSACVNSGRTSTVSDASYRGPLSLIDYVKEKKWGEYLPIFRGSYIRERGYVDLGTRKSCGTISYIRFLQDADFWITPRVIRIYHDTKPGSITSGWTAAAKAAETALCYERLFQEYGSLYKKYARRNYGRKLLRYTVYQRLAGQGIFWRSWLIGTWYSLSLIESLAAFTMLLRGRDCTEILARIGKSLKLIKRYG